MPCYEARKRLYVLDEPMRQKMTLPVQADVVEAQTHVRECAACREFFTAEEQFKNFLKTCVAKEKTPAALREKILILIAQERDRSATLTRRLRGLTPRKYFLSSMLGLLTVVALAAGLWWSKWNAGASPHRLVAILVDDHAHNRAGLAEVNSSDPRVVQSWFSGKVDFAFRLPSIQETSLIGGRLCNLQGHRAALILYQEPQDRISLFIFNGGNVELPEEQLISLDNKRCLISTAKGYNVVLWKQRGLVYGLVSDIRSTDLLRMADRF